MQNEAITSKIQDVIEKIINPILNEHLGGAVLREFKDGIAYVSFTGSCRGCFAAEDTLDNIVKPMILENVKEVYDVILDQSVSEELLDFARNILNKEEIK